MSEYTVVENMEIGYTVSIRNGELEFDPGNDMPWASYTLEHEGKVIAENVSYSGVEVKDIEACRRFARTLDQWIDEDSCENDIAQVVGKKISQDGGDPDQLLEENERDAKEFALALWLTENPTWNAYRSDGDFANEYRLYLVAPGGELPDDIDADELTAEEFAEAWARYPDAITESYVSVEILEAAVANA